MRDVAILIPVFNPSELLMRTICDMNSIESLSVLNKVVIDDGSVYGREWFDNLEENVFICTHKTNQGKGAALKTGFEYIINNFEEVRYVVTVDGDFQHTASDVKKVYDAIFEMNFKSALIIGARDLDFISTPIRSYIGNKTTQLVIRFIYGVKLKDTQSGLRAYSLGVVRDIIKFSRSGYDFEMAALLNAVETKKQINEVKIKTIYIHGNKSSHFRPVSDSIRVYSTIIQKNKLKVFLFFLCIFGCAYYFPKSF